jgi:hypothetical protein
MRRAVENPGVAVYFTSNPAAGHSTPGRLDQNQLQHTAAMQQPHNFRSLTATSIISRPQCALVSNSGKTAGAPWASPRLCKYLCSGRCERCGVTLTGPPCRVVVAEEATGGYRRFGHGLFWPLATLECPPQGLCPRCWLSQLITSNAGAPSGEHPGLFCALPTK